MIDFSMYLKNEEEIGNKERYIFLFSSLFPSFRFWVFCRQDFSVALEPVLDPPVSASQVLGLKVHATTAQLFVFFKTVSLCVALAVLELAL